jgi:hypothetical protein
MKKVLIFSLILLMVLSTTAIAHSPSSMIINYNSEKRELIVSITHTVTNPNSHYIYNIKIEKNNGLYKNFNYTSQPTSSSFTYNYSDIAGINGDVFTVSAYCIQGGQISKSLTVGSITQEKNKSPGFELIIFFIAIFLILFLKRKK